MFRNQALGLFGTSGPSLLSARGAGISSHLSRVDLGTSTFERVIAFHFQQNFTPGISHFYSTAVEHSKCHCRQDETARIRVKFSTGHLHRLPLHPSNAARRPKKLRQCRRSRLWAQLRLIVRGCEAPCRDAFQRRWPCPLGRPLGGREVGPSCSADLQPRFHCCRRRADGTLFSPGC